MQNCFSFSIFFLLGLATPGLASPVSLKSIILLISSLFRIIDLTAQSEVESIPTNLFDK